MNRVRLFLENRFVGRMDGKAAQASADQTVTRRRLVRLSALVSLLIVGMFLASPVTVNAAPKTSQGSGNWTAITWSPVGLPGATDDVIIRDGDSVTLDTSPTIASLQVGQGTSGILTIGDGNNNRTLTVSGAISVSAGGTLTSQGNGGNILNAKGNLTNSGTITDNAGDMNVTFTGTANQLISGGGGTTSFNLITINNTGAANNNIVEVSSSNFTVPAAFLTLTDGIFKVSGSLTLTNTFIAGPGYTIPAGTGIWLNNSDVTVTAQGGTVTLNGSLQITAGTYNVGTATGNTVQYNTGASFTMEGGAVTIAGRFIGNTPATDTIAFNMSGGTLTVANVTFSAATQGGFDIGNAGSSFTMSGGTIVLQNENTNGTALDYRNVAGTVSVTGGTVQFATATTPGSPTFVVGVTAVNNVLPSVSLVKAVTATTVTLATAVTIRGNVTIATSTTLSANGQAISVTGNTSPGTSPGNWSNNGTFTSGTQTTTFNGTASQSIGGTSSTAFSGLTINNSSVSGVILNTSGSVAAILTLTTDLTTTSPAVLTQSGTSAAAAPGDVIGDVRRTDLAPATAKSFGNVDVQVTIGGSGALTTMTINLVKQAPPSFPSAVTRVYTLSPGVGSIGTAPNPTLRLRYRETPTDERNGNTETALQLWRLEGTPATWQPQGGTPDAGNNYVTATVNGFSSWVIAGPNAPTDVAMVDLKATRFGNRVLLEWQTGYEVSNLGFHIYRGKKGNFTRITADPIAGSALIFGPKIALRAGFAYTWWDNDAPAGDDTTYWVEDLDMSGRTSVKGPFYVTSSAPGDNSAAGKGDAPTLGAIASKASKLGSSAPVERRAADIKLTPALLAVQAVTASQQAVKVSVKHEGWYRVEKADLVAAGFPASADPTKLQLSVDGQEVPIRVTIPTSAPVQGAKPTVAPWDGIEFFGLGIDSPYTESHVYWLVAGSQNGLRIGQATDQGGAPAPASFQYSVERRDKITYFAGVKNGGAEKFFGPPIFNAVPVDQSVVLKNAAPTGDATVDVSLQGLSDGSHSVRVLLNGTELGTVQFNGRAKGTAQYSIPQSSLLEGSNQVQFISPVGFSDLTLAEYVRVTYEHTNKADDNALRFPVTGSQLATIGGFTSEAIRVVDVTDAASPQEVPVSVAPDGAEFAATFTVPGAGARTLLAFAADQKKTPAALVANQPSSWRTSKNGATYIAVTRKDLINSLGPLMTQRRNQGHKTALVDIEDVYDEFSFGNKSALALKDFFAYAKTNWKISPLFALLAGDATYDPKNYMGLGDFDLIPTKLVETNFNETATDDWFVDINGDKVPDIAIGRLPVRSAQEAASLAAKIIRYDRSQPVTRVLMVADHNDGYDFEAADTQAQALIPANLTITGIRRGQVGDSLARTQLLDALNVGAKFVNFYGHGSTRLWTDAQILTAADAPNLANTDRLALFDSMTCLTGFFHDVSIESLGEALLKSPGGAISVWASSGMTDPGGQVLMNQEAIRQLFSGAGLTIGEVTARAKAATGNADVRRTWILLGDPATRLR